ncbi:amino acid ABC transporter substrate-binding protein [Sneathiella marina]|uniref:Amino acid ABC transporter substrate-binding protein n=1 Tax=Sneathiella marina TaxID=2950108 RepID=A0ABY4W8C7_9PROT|nr:amino acid ABC transporter substrate-binding protein [Sneathiella marina]USG62005.1 amino acid ABC transporter substrate-binding protein [Sneathiella marina]
MKNERKFLRKITNFTIAALAIPAIIFGFTTTSFSESKSVKIGYAVSKTGPNSAGAGITTIPNYTLWVKDVNAQGGLKLPDGSQRLIEIVEYDDRSSSEEVVRAIERLATQDQVDFILPPWGTGFNLAIAPLMDRFGYPQLAVTAVTDKAPDFANRWTKSFWFLGGGSDYSEALAKVLGAASKAGEINNKVAIVSVADGFGIDLLKSARPAMEKEGMDIVYDKTYPLGTSDFNAIVAEAKMSGADSFVAFSYPPGTFGMTKQSIVSSFNPKVFYLGVGVGFPVYKKIAGINIDGVMSLGGIDINNADFVAYSKRHQEATGTPPDYWASSVTYASLQILQQAIERAGLDKDAVSKEISDGEFDTILGKIKLENNQLRKLWWTGQWKNGNFVAIAPSNRDGAETATIPKPVWQN